jgi:long-chain acyl-CoA synthetase
VNDLLFLAVNSPLDHPPEFAAVDAAFIRFTSGTTSTAKGVVLSHKTVYERIHAANEALAIGEDDTIVWLLSMSYHFTVSIVAYLTFGASILLCSNHFGETIVEEAAAHSGTLIYGSPQHYALMAGDRSGAKLDSLRLAVSTASALKSDIAEAFFGRFGVPLSQAYGIIEIGLPCINLAGEAAKPGSVGKVLPAYEIHLRDIGSAPLRAIDVRGRGLFDAYYSPWRRQIDISPDGWFETGDMGQFDDEGYLYITGRAKEMISVGGMKFFPQEVETVLDTHPSVEEAYVFAESHPRLGEAPHALVKLREQVETNGLSDELRRLCQANLSAFKIPLTIRFVEQLPRTGSGKLKRRSPVAG